MALNMIWQNILPQNKYFQNPKFLVYADETTGELVPISMKPESQPPEPVVSRALSEPGRLLREDTVEMLTGLSRTTLWRMERERRFPRRKKIGLRAVAWRESEVREWIEKRPAG
jgi:prophage regulatory protein